MQNLCLPQGLLRGRHLAGDFINVHRVTLRMIPGFLFSASKPGSEAETMVTMDLGVGG